MSEEAPGIDNNSPERINKIKERIAADHGLTGDEKIQMFMAIGAMHLYGPESEEMNNVVDGLRQYHPKALHALISFLEWRLGIREE